MHDVQPLRAWLIDGGLAGLPLAELLDGCCRRLIALGVPVERAHLSFAALHPQLWAHGLVWRADGAVEAFTLPFGYESGAAWHGSPFRHMLAQEIRRLHRPLEGDAAVLDFPVLQEFRAEGLTGWVGLMHRFGRRLEEGEVGELGAIFSFATGRPGGWSAAHLAALDDLSPALALAVKATSGETAAHDLLGIYIGRDPAQRVLTGHVRRGSVERQDAVVLYADLRGFTDFAGSTRPEEVTRRLNDCFEALGAPIARAGGDILKFLGDGLLATFLPQPGHGSSAAATAALQAAQAGLAALARLNAAEAAAGRRPLLCDIALHAGEVSFGNVGTAGRLDFTMIGPAVNEAARLEGLCRLLGRHLLLSDVFVAAGPALDRPLRSLGRHRLRGVSTAHEVFTLEEAADYAAAPSQQEPP